MAKLYKEEYIKHVRGVCTNKLCVQSPLVTSDTFSTHESHQDSIIYRQQMTSNQTILQQLYSNQPAILEIISFIQEQLPNASLEDFASPSIIKKELELDDIFDEIIEYFKKSMHEMKSNIRVHCLAKQKSLIKGYLDSLKNLFTQNYDSNEIEKILKQDSCYKSDAETIKQYFDSFHSPSRKKLDRLLIGLFNLLETPLSFGEVPEVTKASKFPVKMLDIQHSMIDSIKSHITNMMSFNVFSSIIKESQIYPIQVEPFRFDETVASRINTNDNGWLSSIVSFPPVALMHQVGDTRLPIMYHENSGNLNNAIALASTEGNVSIWGMTGKLRDVFKEGKLINFLLPFPPIKLPKSQEDEEVKSPKENYSALIAGFWTDHVTLWDINTLERRLSTRLAHESFLSAGIIYPLRVETQHPYYKHLPKTVEYRYCLVTTGADLTIKIWSIPDLKPIKTIMNVHKTMVTGLAIFAYNFESLNKAGGQGPKKGQGNSIAKDGRAFYLVSYEKDIKTWNIEKNRIEGQYNHYQTITSLVVVDSATEDDPYADILKKSKRKYKPFYIFSSGNSIYILSFQGHKLVKRISDAHEGGIRKLELVNMKVGNSEQNLYLVSIGVDRTVKVWDWKKGKCVKVIESGIKCDGPTMLSHQVFDGNLRKQVMVIAGRSAFGKKVMNIYNQ